MASVERRNNDQEKIAALKRELNEPQSETLEQLERFGWNLRFLRRPPFQQSVGVVMNPDSHRLAVLEIDGTLNEQPPLLFRE